MFEKNAADSLYELGFHPYVTAEQIPPLSLYMDQILSLFSTGSQEEQSLTKAMVNNYSKEKILRPIKGKKYSREQILQLLLICRMKSVLSMDEIKQVMTALMDEGAEETRLEQMLSHADRQQEITKAVAALVEEQLADKDRSEQVLLLSQLSAFFSQAAKEMVKDGVVSSEEDKQKDKEK